MFSIPFVQYNVYVNIAIFFSVASDSEYEDDDAGHVVLPQTLKSRGNIENNKSEIKLHEIGPRYVDFLFYIEDSWVEFQFILSD